ncbi:MAG TPA: hypothetical protein VGK77_17125 [Candidatus Binatia bacterium]
MELREECALDAIPCLVSGPDLIAEGLDHVISRHTDVSRSGLDHLVGDAADGYPGIPGIGPIGAARLLNRHGIIEGFPPAVLGGSCELALLFKNLATLRNDARLFRDVDELRWRGPTEAFTACAEHLGEVRLLERSLKAQKITQMTHLL